MRAADDGRRKNRAERDRAGPAQEGPAAECRIGHDGHSLTAGTGVRPAFSWQPTNILEGDNAFRRGQVAAIAPPARSAYITLPCSPPPPISGTAPRSSPS